MSLIKDEFERWREHNRSTSGLLPGPYETYEAGWLACKRHADAWGSGEALKLLRDLEWSATRGTAPAYMGGRSMGSLPACPKCDGVEPSHLAEFEFNASAIGHRPDCELARQIRELK